MWLLTTLDIQQQLSQFIWPFFRIAGFFLVVPIIGTRMVPIRVRLLLALSIAFISFNLIDQVPAMDPLSLHALVIGIQQTLIGMAMGFIVQLLFQVCVIGGQLIAMQNGLGFAQMMDPVNGVSVATVSQFFIISANLIFLAMNGHLVLIRMLIESFQVLPIDGRGLPMGGVFQLVAFGGWMFKSGLMIALPALIALLVINISFGVMSKAAPQMNIISIGFPFTLMTGLVVLWIVISGFHYHFMEFSNETFVMINRLISP